MNTTAYSSERCTKVYENDELVALFAAPPAYYLRRVEHASVLDCARELIEMELPSDLRLLSEVTAYLSQRAAQFGVISGCDGSLGPRLRTGGISS